jgi:predicted nucleotidyltransferase component of viral defense system
VTLTRGDLEREAATTGFAAETLEKAIRLLSLLNALRSHPFLKGRIALKGGTALNLFVFEVPRLSVDIDMNYIGARDRDTMLAERPRLEEAIHAVCGRERLTVKRVPAEHAGGKWRLGFSSALVPGGHLELDVNFLLRIPLWSVSAQDSRPVGSFRAIQVPVLDVHELAAGKLAALLARGAGRDIFDAVQLLRRGDLDARKLRLGFVVYGGANRRDWRTVSADDVHIAPEEFRRELLPTLRSALVSQQGDVAAWAKALVEECRQRLSVVLPLRREEIEFLTLLNDRGEIAPDLLTSDETTKAAIREHPALLWKTLDLARRGRPTDQDPF